ncbi:hypothetical protein N658DRAFT_32303 [Parathielavia hyrcaniae]|uniref:Uncharacterized protein n=1 Tax=Parathielavia hyrcaniae TaxID=113614 RepID=A0AAN6QC42_9PEZI|nr:hypothetical protein N658DRAFT_32303 [Parathielavia hyrcaniae]
MSLDTILRKCSSRVFMMEIVVIRLKFTDHPHRHSWTRHKYNSIVKSEKNLYIQPSPGLFVSVTRDGDSDIGLHFLFLFFLFFFLFLFLLSSSSSSFPSFSCCSSSSFSSCFFFISYLPSVFFSYLALLSVSSSSLPSLYSYVPRYQTHQRWIV